MLIQLLSMNNGPWQSRFADGCLVTSTQADYMKQYGKNLEILGKIYPDARIGLVVPDYVDIHSIDQLNANKEKFGGEIIGIDAGAGLCMLQIWP